MGLQEKLKVWGAKLAVSATVRRNFDSMNATLGNTTDDTTLLSVTTMLHSFACDSPSHKYTKICR